MIMAFILYPIIWACSLYTFVLLARVVVDLVLSVMRDWRPAGAAVVIINVVYVLTDPPLRIINRYIPPLRLGGVALDLGFIVLFIGVRMLQNLAIVLLQV